MALQRATVVGSGNVIEAYKLFANSRGTYSVWYGPRDKYFQPAYDSFDDNLDFLEQILTTWETMSDSTLYYLRVHPDNLRSEVIDNKTPYTVDFPFRPVALPKDAVAMGLVSGMPYGFQETMKTLQDRITELEADQEPEQSALLGQLSGLLEQPQIVEALSASIGAILQRIVGSVLPQQQAYNSPVRNLNGMPQQEQQQAKAVDQQIDPVRLDNTLVRLSKHINLNVDLEKLADYLDKNPGNVPMILGFLK